MPHSVPPQKVPKKPWGEQNVLAPRTWAWLPKSSFKGARKRVLGMNRWACASLPGFATDPQSEFWVSEMACMPREHRLPTSASESTTCISPPSGHVRIQIVGHGHPSPSLHWPQARSFVSAVQSAMRVDGTVHPRILLLGSRVFRFQLPSAFRCE